MKKSVILILLITAAAAFGFAQVTIKPVLELDDLTEAVGKMDPKFGFVFTGDAALELESALFKAGIQVAPVMHFQDKAGYQASDLDDNFVYGNFALPAGPGSLGFTLKFFLPFNPIQIGVDYKELAAGPAVLGFGAWYNLTFTGYSDAAKDEKFPLGRDPENADKLGLWVDAAFDFGLYIKYEFQFGVGKMAAGTGKSEIVKIVYLDVNYRITPEFVAGLEVDDTGKEFKGFTLKPYVSYDIAEDMSAGVYFKVKGLNAEAGDPVFAPGVWFKYTL